MLKSCTRVMRWSVGRRMVLLKRRPCFGRDFQRGLSDVSKRGIATLVCPPCAKWGGGWRQLREGLAWGSAFRSVPLKLRHDERKKNILKHLSYREGAHPHNLISRSPTGIAPRESTWKPWLEADGFIFFFFKPMFAWSFHLPRTRTPRCRGPPPHGPPMCVDRAGPGPPRPWERAALHSTRGPGFPSSDKSLPRSRGGGFRCDTVLTCCN